MSSLIPGRPRRQTYRRSNTLGSSGIGGVVGGGPEPDPYVSCASGFLDKFSGSGGGSDVYNGGYSMGGKRSAAASASTTTTTSSIKDFLKGRREINAVTSTTGLPATMASPTSTSSTASSPSSYLPDSVIEELKMASYRPKYQPRYSYLINSKSGPAQYSYISTYDPPTPRSTAYNSTADLDTTHMSTFKGPASGGASASLSSELGAAAKYLPSASNISSGGLLEKYSQLSRAPSSSSIQQLGSVKKSKSYSNFDSFRRDPLAVVSQFNTFQTL